MVLDGNWNKSTGDKKYFIEAIVYTPCPIPDIDSGIVDSFITDVKDAIENAVTAKGFDR